MTVQRGPGGSGAPGASSTQATPPGPPMRRPGGGPGMFGMGLPPAKAKDFRGSFRRLIDRLRPERPLIAIVIVLAVISVAFAVIGPKILGNATNDIFAGVLSKGIPAGVTQEQVVAGLRAQGKDQLADMLGSMHLTPGQGVDFADLASILTVLIGIYR